LCMCVRCICVCACLSCVLVYLLCLFLGVRLPVCAAAYRRIESMRLIREVPEAEERIKKGDLNLTTACAVSGFFKSQKKECASELSRKSKLDFIEMASGKSKREVEDLMIQNSRGVPEKLQREKTRRIKILIKDSKKAVIKNSNGFFMEAQSKDEKIITEIRFYADDELTQMIEACKDNFACPQDTNPSIATVFKKLAKAYLEQKNDKNNKTNPKTPLTKFQSKKRPTSSLRFTSPANLQGIKKSRYISVHIKKELNQRSNKQCEYRFLAKGSSIKRCSAKRGLQVDHILPFAKGGESKLYNLQLLCPEHNRFRAIQSYGPKKLKNYIAGIAD